MLWLLFSWVDLISENKKRKKAKTMQLLLTQLLITRLRLHIHFSSLNYTRQKQRTEMKNRRASWADQNKWWFLKFGLFVCCSSFKSLFLLLIAKSLSDTFFSVIKYLLIALLLKMSLVSVQPSLRETHHVDDLHSDCCGCWGLWFLLFILFTLLALTVGLFSYIILLFPFLNSFPVLFLLVSLFCFKSFYILAVSFFPSSPGFSSSFLLS